MKKIILFFLLFFSGHSYAGFCTVGNSNFSGVSKEFCRVHRSAEFASYGPVIDVNHVKSGVTYIFQFEMFDSRTTDPNLVVGRYWDNVGSPPPLECPSGTSDFNGQCQSDPQCPATLDFTGITLDNPSGCTSLDPSNNCPAGQHPSSFDGSCVNDDCLDGNYINPLTGNCEPILWSCPLGTSPLGNVCVADATPEPEPSCPDNFTFNGFSCVYDNPVPPACSSGFHLDIILDVCVPTPTAPNPSDGSCLSGSSVGDDGQCHIDTVPTDQTVECPSDSTYNGTTCVKAAVCPEGTSMLDGLCQPPTNSCKQGFTFKDGTCQPDFQLCPDGTMWNGSSCVPTEIKTDKQCQSGSTLIDGVCVASFNNCPAGYSLSGATCIKDSDPNDNQPATCPFGTSLSGGKCVTNKDSTCPKGYIKVGESCELETSFKDSGCKSDPVCKGDPVQCAIARQGWQDNCGQQQLTTKQVKDALGFLTVLDDGTEITLDGLDTSGLGLDSTCPAPRNYQVLSTTFTVDLTPFCSIAEIIGNLILITASFVSIRIIASA